MLIITTPKSSMIEKIAYDPVFCHLFVTFKSHSIYRYVSVPKSIFDDFTSVLMQDQSIGKYFNAHVRNNFSYVKL